MDVATYHVRTSWLLIIFISVTSILILLSAFTTSQTCEREIQKNEDSVTEFCNSDERNVARFVDENVRTQNRANYSLIVISASMMTVVLCFLLTSVL